VSGEWIYFVIMNRENHTWGVYRMKTDGSNKTVIRSESYEYPSIVGDWIFFNNNGKVNRMKKDGSEVQVMQ